MEKKEGENRQGLEQKHNERRKKQIRVRKDGLPEGINVKPNKQEEPRLGETRISFQVLQ